MSDHRSASTAASVSSPLNLSVVQGTISRPPVVRESSGSAATVSFDVVVTHDEGPSDLVPVLVVAPSARLIASLEAGAGVTVRGRVRRRFFRTGTTTASRTEVVAESIALTRQRSKAAVVIQGAGQVLTGAG
jgi:hypothetical protein